MAKGQFYTPNSTSLIMKQTIYAVTLLLFICSAFALVGQENKGGDFFPTSTPEAEGIATSGILSFIERAEEEIDAIHSIMILRNGNLITEGWWSPYNAETPHVMHSLSKSFTSTAIGLLIAEGKLSLNDKVLAFFPDDAPDEPSWQLQNMRIRDLITMNTGHTEEPMVWSSKGNWIKTFLDAEVKLNPGTHFKYNSAATYMLSAILQKVTGEKLVDYLEPRLFQPLQIKKPHWDTCPKGINTGGWGLQITTTDIAKLGQLYLQKGVWKGERILREDWVAMATSKQVSNGSDPDNDWNQGYGFQFWQCRHNAYRGDGAMGQYCIVIPEHDMVVAITSGVYDMGAVMNLVWEEILPAIKSEPLPANPELLKELSQKTANLRLAPIGGTTTTAISKKISKNKFNIANDSIGIKSITFKLHKTQPSIQFEMEKGIETVQIGINEYLKGTLNNHLPYTDNLLKKIATSGAWIKPNVYQVRIYFYGMPDRITYTFQFEEDQLIWDSKLEHSLFGPQKQEQLNGKR